MMAIIRHVAVVHSGIALFILASFGAASPSTKATAIQLSHTISIPVEAKQLAYSDNTHRIYSLDESGTISVFNSDVGTLTSQHTPNHQFTDFDLTPDGRYLFAADFGGEQPNGVQVEPHYVHRYDSLNNTWTSHAIDGIAYHIEAVRTDRILVLSFDQATYLRLYAYDDNGTRQLDGMWSDAGGGMEYDDHTGTIVRGNLNSTSKNILTHILVGDDIQIRQTGGAYYQPWQLGGGTYALSPDGSFFYYGRVQARTLDIIYGTRLFPESIYAASDSIAFGRDAYYGAADAAQIGSLGYASDVKAMGVSGQTLAVYHDINGIHSISFYGVPEPSTGFLLLASAAGSLLTWRRR